jgi:hypothetical protein
MPDKILLSQKNNPTGVSSTHPPGRDVRHPASLSQAAIAKKKRELAAACEKTIEALHSFGRETAFKDDITLLGIEYLGNNQTPDES